MGQSQSHEVSSSGTGDERRIGRRRDAGMLGPVVARLVGGSEVRLIDFSQRGVLLESDTRMLIGARATIKITTTDAVVMVAGYVVRSRVAGVRDSALLYHTAMSLNDDLGELEEAAKRRELLRTPTPTLRTFPKEVPTEVAGEAPTTVAAGSDDAYPAVGVPGIDVSDGDPVLEFLATVPHDLAELRRRAAVNNW